jgi:hypothetical protein
MEPLTRGCRPQIPDLSALYPQLNLLKPPRPEKILCTLLIRLFVVYRANINIRRLLLSIVTNYFSYVNACYMFWYSRPYSSIKINDFEIQNKIKCTHTYIYVNLRFVIVFALRTVSTIETCSMG